jgi:predicted nuclease with TOPRIM domain
MFEKLRNSVPKDEYNSMCKNYELAQQKYNDLIPQNKQLIADRTKLKSEERKYMEAEERFKHLEDEKDEVEQELRTIRRRLEKFDKSFLWEN